MLFVPYQIQQNQSQNGLGNIFDKAGYFLRNNSNVFSGIPVVGQLATIGARISQNNVDRNNLAKQEEQQRQLQQEAIKRSIQTKPSFFAENKEIIIASVVGVTLITAVIIATKKDNKTKSKSKQSK
ncbi:hypothetical protein V9L05_08665 [Bernardetia sp. Wsw4-3y2]|uniref:hypothetical protein n=1 Tax=Bernardetia sp. Wsw4-3y2 TaxID=3127471 RepID=UPI0030CC2542